MPQTELSRQPQKGWLSRAADSRSLFVDEESHLSPETGLSRADRDDCFRRKPIGMTASGAERKHKTFDGLPLIARKRPFALRSFDARVCPVGDPANGLANPAELDRLLPSVIVLRPVGRRARKGRIITLNLVVAAADSGMEIPTEPLLVLP